MVARGGEVVTSRSARRLAWGLWVVAATLAALALVYLVLGRSTPPPPGSFGFRGFSIIFALSFGTVGALIASRQPRNAIGWVFLALALVSGFQELTQQFGIYAVLSGHGPLGLGRFAAWFPSWIWIPATSGVMYLLLLYPGDRRPARGSGRKHEHPQRSRKRDDV